jgi:GR25 family glycosyltransferase involved in LPS biosynthesis
MVIDRKNGWVYVPTTEADKQALMEWAKTYPTLRTVSALTPQQAGRYRTCVLMRPERERLAMGLQALVHTENGRRFANRYHLSSFAQALRFLESYPHAKAELLDFSNVEGHITVPVGDFTAFLAERGYPTAPTFVAASPIPLPWFPKTSMVRNNDIHCVYINVDAHEERRKRMDEGLVSVGWIAARLSATTPNDIGRWSDIEGYDQMSRKRQIEYALSVSHLRALEDVVRSGCGWGLVMEDDIDLESSRNWAFDLNDIPALLPEDCGIFQMQMTWPISRIEGTNVSLKAPESLSIRSSVPNQDWGTGAYMVRREYAQEVLSWFRDGERYRFQEYPGLPVSDAFLFDSTFFSSVYRAHCAPLMTCREEESTVGNDSPMQNLMQRASRILSKNLAEKAGKIKVSDVFQPVIPTDYPFVSIITPTYNRRHLLPLLEDCILRQIYPRCRMEWVLVDDSQDGQPPFTPRENTGLSIQHIVLREKMTLGAKRNFTLSQAKGNICVYMDDDDFYPPTRVNLVVEALQKHPEVHAVGTTFMPIYFIELDEYYLAGPWGQNHTTAGSLAHRRILSETQKYDAEASFAEEKSFLDHYSIPLVQLDPYQTMTCIAHGTNTYDKRRVLGSNKVKPSEKPISEIIPEPLMEQYLAHHKVKS